MIRATLLLTALLTLLVPVAAQALRGPVDPPETLHPGTAGTTHPPSIPTECLTMPDEKCE